MVDACDAISRPDSTTDVTDDPEGGDDVSLNVVVAGLPKAVQGAADPHEGLWLTDEQCRRIIAAAPEVCVEHIPVSHLNAGRPPKCPPHVIMVETSGTVDALDAEVGILTRVGLDQLLTPELTLIQSMSAGAEHLVGIVPEGVTLANASGVAAKAIAETVFAAILADAKRLEARRENQVARAWREEPARELEGSVMSILGTGHIGSQTARLASAFGIRTIGVNRRRNAAPDFDEIVSADELLDALAVSDYLVIAAPLTPQTRGLVDAKAMAAMKPGGWIANVARGAIHDADALVDALRSGHLRGALVDCHVAEPLPPDDPLWTAPGARVLPHDSHASQLLGDRQVDVLVDNLGRLAAGRPLRNVVDVNRGY